MLDAAKMMTATLPPVSNSLLNPGKMKMSTLPPTSNSMLDAKKMKTSTLPPASNGLHLGKMPAANKAAAPGDFRSALNAAQVAGSADKLKEKDDPVLREAFDNFVGETFFGQMMSSMRKTVGKSAYFYGGRTEEIFQKQLDQTMATELTKASANTFTGPMYDLFVMNRK